MKKKIQIILETKMEFDEKLQEEINYVLQRECDWDFEIQSVKVIK